MRSHAFGCVVQDSDDPSDLLFRPDNNNPEESDSSSDRSDDEQYEIESTELEDLSRSEEQVRPILQNVLCRCACSCQCLQTLCVQNLDELRNALSAFEQNDAQHETEQSDSEDPVQPQIFAGQASGRTMQRTRSMGRTRQISLALPGMSLTSGVQRVADNSSTVAMELD